MSMSEINLRCLIWQAEKGLCLMKFTANRKIMLEHLKSMARVVPKSSPVQELRGFLVEANEDDGYLYLTANNLEAAIQRRFKPEVEAGGEFVMEAKMLIDILSLLAETDVVFEEIKPGIIEIKSGYCTYTMHVLSGRIYPRPEMPFPEDTVKTSGLRQLYSKTYLTVAANNATPALSGLHIEINGDGLKAISCNGQCVALAGRETKCDGRLSFTLPKATYSYLAGAISDDDELEVGVSGPYVTFMKEGMMFSARHIPHEYVDVNKLFDSIKPTYTAKLEFDSFRDQVDTVCNIAAMGSETSYVKLYFINDRIEISTKNDLGGGQGTVEAVCIDCNEEYSFYYPANRLKDIFKTVEGTLVLQLDKRGYLLVFDRYSKFMMTPVTEQAVKKQMEHFSVPKKAPKSKAEQNPKAA